MKDEGVQKSLELRSQVFVAVYDFAFIIPRTLPFRSHGMCRREKNCLVGSCHSHLAEDIMKTVVEVERAGLPHIFGKFPAHFFNHTFFCLLLTKTFLCIKETQVGRRQFSVHLTFFHPPGNYAMPASNAVISLCFLP